MRKLLISAAITALFTLPALAQPGPDEHGRGGAPQGGEHGGPPNGGPPHGGGTPHAGGAPHPQPGGNSGRPPMGNSPSFNRGPNGGAFNRPAPAAPTFNRGPNGGAFNRPATATPAFNRGPNGGNARPGGPNMAGRPAAGGAPGPMAGRHDFRSFGDYHQNFNAARRFHAPAYRRPPGWYPHRWVFGEILPAAFWARDYWLTDYMDYALPPPPPYAVWVRYGNDALLIDQDSGEIITVEYGVFY